MLVNAQTPERARSESKTAEEPTNYPTSWASEDFPIDRKPLEIDVLKNGGLTMVKLPYNEEGAVDKRDAINSMSCDYMLQNNLFNPMFLDQVMRTAQSANTTSVHGADEDPALPAPEVPRWLAKQALQGRA